ncbi:MULTISPECIES: DUF6193 family natural product biosynthesis protein [unclassified Streptomyces]|uniref:DUF6193 family natural product biosynthesis protein n=1 Tax=unclassified Streptomyces TaxID=2593676 RepID=UPI00225C14EF|nr:DUF6193 family natural product biosynthesis protein [Streptomyces sp. NBC_01500]MCX4550137.1 DUF6193 family natural product biosynthesis protein [Streptomyces sp. NBC_01500]WSV55593.1 DUF6193 family natural product biosynthesis protein [Streptomyces sp. NBC_01014]
MEFENDDSNLKSSSFLDASLYPDLIQLGGLVPAMVHVAEMAEIDLPSIRPQSQSGRARFSTARLESTDCVVLILLGLDERWFSISIECDGHPWASGGTDDLMTAVRVANSRHEGASLSEIGRKFPFMHHSELAQAYESGDPVKTQWRLLLSDSDFHSSRPLLQEIHSNDQLRALFPFFSHGVLRLAKDHSDRTAGEIWITPLPDSRYRIKLTNSDTADREAKSIQQTIEILLHFLDHL